MKAHKTQISDCGHVPILMSFILMTALVGNLRLWSVFEFVSI